MGRMLIFSVLVFQFFVVSASAESIPRKQLMLLTAEWNGERFAEGRPELPDAIRTRIQQVSLEEAWKVLRSHGDTSRFAGGWRMVHPDVPVVGWAMTALYIPAWPKLATRIVERGPQEGRMGPINSWPIDTLQEGDVDVAASFGIIADGARIGEHLGNSISIESGSGVVFDGPAPDLAGLAETRGFNAFVRGIAPSLIKDRMLPGLNAPIHVGRVTVPPGTSSWPSGMG